MTMCFVMSFVASHINRLKITTALTPNERSLLPFIVRVRSAAKVAGLWLKLNKPTLSRSEFAHYCRTSKCAKAADYVNLFNSGRICCPFWRRLFPGTVRTSTAF